MKVFVLYGSWDYDTSINLGVYSSREKALEALARFKEVNAEFMHDSYGVDELELDVDPS